MTNINLVSELNDDCFGFLSGIVITHLQECVKEIANQLDEGAKKSGLGKDIIGDEWAELTYLVAAAALHICIATFVAEKHEQEFALEIIMRTKERFDDFYMKYVKGSSGMSFEEFSAKMDQQNRKDGFENE